MKENLTANISSDLSEILDKYSKVEKETVEFLKRTLRFQTERAVTQKIFEGHKPFPNTVNENYAVLYVVAPLGDRRDERDSRVINHNLVLTFDGKLFKYREVGEADETGDWTYSVFPEEEAEPRQYIDFAPNLIRKMEMAIREG